MTKIGMQGRLVMDLLRIDEATRRVIKSAKGKSCESQTLPLLESLRRDVRESRIESRDFLKATGIHLSCSALGVFLKCDKCAGRWHPKTRRSAGRLPEWWRCPKGCNADHPALK